MCSDGRWPESSCCPPTTSPRWSIASPPPSGIAGGADGLRSLTPREREILQTLAGGASTAEVAEAFGISPLTVQSHVKNILAKLGVHSKVDAVRIAWRHGVATASRPPVRAG